MKDLVSAISSTIQKTPPRMLGEHGPNLFFVCLRSDVCVNVITLCLIAFNLVCMGNQLLSKECGHYS